jgi:uncharacterized membrane protein YtjA (UPF0391 family)
MANIWGLRVGFDRSYPAFKRRPFAPFPASFFIRDHSFERREPLFPGTIISAKAPAPVVPAPRFETEAVMLGWVVTFLIIALISGVLGFGGVAGASIEIAKAIFFIAVVLFIVSAVVGVARGRKRI